MSPSFYTRGSRLGMNRIKVKIDKDGRVSTTIPRQIARDSGINQKGTVVEFEYVKEYNIIVIKPERR
jgi:bifunctional DNA-binding transcriptional regulator/antitoxin component of YhaV-PrlF toxin-antitoxin module